MILTDKRIVITGGTGSLGKTLVYRIPPVALLKEHDLLISSDGNEIIYWRTKDAG